MRFFKIKLFVQPFLKEKTIRCQEIIGAKDEETALALAKAEWQNECEILEIGSCEEIFPEAVICERIMCGGNFEWPI